jgi:hypothetical protein
MADTTIEWIEKTSRPVRATAAARLGIALAEYEAKLASGKKWCGGCRRWEPRSVFATDNSRGDGLTSRCRNSRNTAAKAAYVPKPRPTAGRRIVAARNGDQLQARRRVNYLIEAALMPAPNTLSCTDCGHIWAEGERRHEYDHFRGYAPEHHEDVQPVCTTCHHLRENARKTAA